MIVFALYCGGRLAGLHGADSGRFKASEIIAFAAVISFIWVNLSKKRQQEIG